MNPVIPAVLKTCTINILPWLKVSEYVIVNLRLVAGCGKVKLHKRMYIPVELFIMNSFCCG